MPTFTFKERLSARLNLLPVAIHDSFTAVLFGRVLVLASKFGIFESLNEQSKSIEELALSLNLHVKSTELICESLIAGNYLKKMKEKFSLAPQAKKWLVKSSPNYLGNFLAYIELLHSHWMYLEETLKHGKPPKTYVETFTEQEWKIYTYGMMDLAKLILPKLLPKLKLPSESRTLLDLGGSHGLYSIELCKRYPNLHATIADFPQVLSHTAQIMKDHHLEERIKLLPSDVMKESFPQNYFDVVLAFNIVHGFDAETNRKFFQSISSALKKGGTVFVLDQLRFQSGRGIQQLLPLIVGINLLNEIGGNVYSFDEIKKWCVTAGLGKVTLHRLNLPGVFLVSTRKI